MEGWGTPLQADSAAKVKPTSNEAAAPPSLAGWPYLAGSTHRHTQTHTHREAMLPEKTRGPTGKKCNTKQQKEEGRKGKTAGKRMQTGTGGEGYPRLQSMSGQALFLLLSDWLGVAARVGFARFVMKAVRRAGVRRCRHRHGSAWPAYGGPRSRR